MLITFIGDPLVRFDQTGKRLDPSDPPELTIHGMTFPLGEAVPVPDGSEWAKQFADRIRKNNHFRVEPDGEPVEAAPPPGQPEGEPIDPLDHDADGEKGGSMPAEQRGDEIARLRQDLTSLGVTSIDLRWGPKRLQAEIDRNLGK